MLAKSKITEIQTAFKGIPIQDRKEVVNLLKKYFDDLTQQARCKYRIGDRVSFNTSKFYPSAPNGKEISGTIQRINTKTITLKDCDDGGPGWRVPFHMINP